MCKVGTVGNRAEEDFAKWVKNRDKQFKNARKRKNRKLLLLLEIKTMYELPAEKKNTKPNSPHD